MMNEYDFVRTETSRYIKHSEWGSNDSDNLMLLCASCHAEEHKNEHVYRVLKAIAEGIIHDDGNRINTHPI